MNKSDFCFELGRKFVFFLHQLDFYAYHPFHETDLENAESFSPDSDILWLRCLEKNCPTILLGNSYPRLPKDVQKIINPTWVNLHSQSMALAARAKEVESHENYFIDPSGLDNLIKDNRLKKGMLKIDRPKNSEPKEFEPEEFVLMEERILEEDRRDGDNLIEPTWLNNQPMSLQQVARFSKEYIAFLRQELSEPEISDGALDAIFNDLKAIRLEILDNPKSRIFSDLVELFITAYSLAESLDSGNIFQFGCLRGYLEHAEPSQCIFTRELFQRLSGQFEMPVLPQDIENERYRQSLNTVRDWIVNKVEAVFAASQPPTIPDPLTFSDLPSIFEGIEAHVASTSPDELSGWSKHETISGLTWNSSKQTIRRVINGKSRDVELDKNPALFGLFLTLAVGDRKWSKKELEGHYDGRNRNDPDKEDCDISSPIHKLKKQLEVLNLSITNYKKSGFYRLIDKTESRQSETDTDNR